MGLREWFGLSAKQPVEEAAPKALAQPGPVNVARKAYEYGIPPGGLTEYTATIGQSAQTDRRSFLQSLYESFLACPWSWSCVNVIAKTITAGPLVFDWDSDDGEGDEQQPDKPPEVLACERLFRYTNEREDIRQLMRSTISDLLVFGDAFIEVVWVAGVPAALYSLDSPSMSVIADAHGAVSSYVQITEFQQRAEFQPHEVIHISLDSPRSGMFGVSPTQAVLLPMTAWLFAAATLKEVYRKGAPINIHVDMPQGMPQPEINRWTAQYMAQNVGPRNIGRPVMTKGGATVNELGYRKVEELLHTLDQKRDEIVSGYGVPPALAGIIESGNLGGGTGESQRRTFMVNTCQPLAAIVLEKIDYHLVKRGFGIQGWHVKFDDVDMRDSEVIERIRDLRVRNGSYTLDRYRAEIGEPSVDGGDTPILVDRQNLVRWRDMDAFSKALVAKNIKGTDLSLDDPGDEDTPVSLSKVAPQPVPPALAAHTGLPGVPPPGADPAQSTGQPADQQGGESYQGRPVREQWSALYQQRLRQALSEMGREDDGAA